MTSPITLRDASCADDYDPNSMPVERARALIRQFLTPIAATERAHVRAALGRVLAEAEDAFAEPFEGVIRDATLLSVGGNGKIIPLKTLSLYAA